MRKTLFILCLLILFNFSVKLLAQQHSEGQYNHNKFDYDLHVTNGDATIHLAVYASKINGESFKIKTSDDKAFLKEFQALLDDEGSEALQNIWCDQFMHQIPENAAFTLNALGNKVFSFSPVSDPNDEMGSGEFMVNIEVSANNHQVLSYHLKNRKPFSPAFATKVHSYEYKATCLSLLPERNALKELTVAVKGKAYMYPYSELIKRVYSNYKLSK